MIKFSSVAAKMQLLPERFIDLLVKKFLFSMEKHNFLESKNWFSMEQDHNDLKSIAAAKSSPDRTRAHILHTLSLSTVNVQWYIIERYQAQICEFLV